MKNKIKAWYQKNKLDVIFMSLIILTILLEVGLWRFKKIESKKTPITIEEVR